MTQTDLQDRLANLRRDRGAATLAGKKFDSSAIASLEAEIDALTDAEGERVRRERETDEAARQKNLIAKRAELATLRRDYLKHNDTAEAALRSHAEAVGAALATARQMAAAVHALSGERGTPAPLSGPEVEHRIAGRHAAIMSSIRGHKYRLGHLEWIAGHHDAIEKWADSEAATLARHIDPLTGDNAK